MIAQLLRPARSQRTLQLTATLIMSAHEFVTALRRQLENALGQNTLTLRHPIAQLLGDMYA